MDIGGGVWESNPPELAFACLTNGFEDRARHQTRFASIFQKNSGDKLLIKLRFFAKICQVFA